MTLADGHLVRDASGHLKFNSAGHLSYACTACTNCLDLPSSLLISGLTSSTWTWPAQTVGGDCDEASCATCTPNVATAVIGNKLNGTYCTYQTYDPAAVFSSICEVATICIGGRLCVITMLYDDSNPGFTDTNGNVVPPLSKVWFINVYGGDGFRYIQFYRVATGVCDHAGSYIVNFGGFCGPTSYSATLTAS